MDSNANVVISFHRSISLKSLNENSSAKSHGMPMCVEDLFQDLFGI